MFKTSSTIRFVAVLMIDVDNIGGGNGSSVISAGEVEMQRHSIMQESKGDPPCGGSVQCYEESGQWTHKGCDGWASGLRRHARYTGFGNTHEFLKTLINCLQMIAYPAARYSGV